MKKLFGLFLLTLCLVANSQDVAAVNFTDVKFGNKQMGDSSSWNVYNCVYTTSCTAGNIGNVGSMRNGNGQNFTLGSTQYMKFSYTNSVAGEPWTITVYNANGTVAAVLGTYRIINAGNGYFMTSNQPHPNAGNGTLWSTQVGMVSMAPAVTFSGTPQPTLEQMNALANSYYSPDPITVSGQTYTPPPPPYSSGITTAQQTRRDGAAIRRQAVINNSIYIDQVGDNNTVTISQQGNNNQIKGVGQQSASIQGNYNNITVRQGTTSGSSSGKNLVELQVTGDSNTLNLNQGRNSDGTNPGADSNNHYQMLNLSGSSNSVTTVQKDGTNTGAGHFMENTISGNSNVINLAQQGTAGKVLFTNVNGNSNNVTTNQKDTGNHYLDVGLVGNGHTVNVVQEGAGNHAATINLTNAGASGTVNLNQSGTTNQTYSIQQSCTTTGCGATITQY
jgi:hypothetical protein